MSELQTEVLPPADDSSSRLSLRWVNAGVIVLLAVLVAAAGIRWWINQKQAHTLSEWTHATLRRSVAVTHATQGAATRNVTLPATLRGYQESAIYARTNGYVSAWRKTIGDKVRNGELLATLSAPEQEQELVQARASVEQVRARVALAATSLKRWELQFQYKMIAEQMLDEKRSEYQQAQADLNAAAANVKRLELLLGLQRIVAPFDGVITRRSVDVGVLVTAGTKELFAMTQTDPLRLTVWVPQSYAAEVQPGQAVKVSVSERPNEQFSGNIEHVSGAIDTVTRTRQVDVALPNKEGRLLPGAYAQVNLDLTSSVSALILPANVIVLGKDGPRVVVVDQRNRLEYRPVKLGRDMGKEIEVLSGVTSADLIVTNPSDLLQPGEEVVVSDSSASQDKSKVVAKTN